MAGSARILAVLVAAIVIGSGIGGVVGHRLGTDAVVSHWAQTNAQHTQEMIRSLEYLRTGRETEALAALETHLNRHVFGLMPSSMEGSSISDTARKQVAEATWRVRAYRGTYPYPGDTALDRDVRHFLGSE